MNKETIKAFTEMLDNIFANHPISEMFRKGIDEDEESDNSLQKLRTRVKDGKFSSLSQIYQEIERVIQCIETFDKHLQYAGDDLRRLIKKQQNLYFPSPSYWGSNVARIRSKLNHYTANDVPNSVKQLCQWPSKQPIEKPDIPTITEEDVEKLVKRLNSLKNNDDIFNIIANNEPDIKIEGEINLSTLKASTLICLMNYCNNRV